MEAGADFLGSEGCVVGVDATEGMLAVARKKFGGYSNVSFDAALAEKLPYPDGSFGRAVSTFFFHHIDYGLKQKVLAEMWRTLVPGGKAVVVGLAGVVEDPMRGSVQSYFEKHVKLLAEASQQQPTKKSFRKIMKPLVKDLREFREATLLSSDFVIQQAYFRRHRLAVGYDLKTVDSLKVFYEKMQKYPEPQISGPTKAKLMRPSVIVLRHPILHDKKLIGIVSLMVSTESFLADVELANCKAYRIRCSDGIEISKGELSKECRKAEVALPSAEWVIEYDL